MFVGGNKKSWVIHGADLIKISSQRNGCSERNIRNTSKYRLKGLGGRQTEEPEIGFGENELS
jgi:hypothetical protein